MTSRVGGWFRRIWAEPLGDLTGRGDQPSGRVVQEDLAEPLGDLTGRGDQPSGKVVQEDLVVLEFLSWSKRVSLKSRLHYRR